ncbi:MAG: iron-containing alcohol dehydrogenase [Pseudomonadales bacterium]|nr:iron-containing alcohol dehydrogenase [Halioglobus sp.]MCP5128168.1 iron-containing alcohol dehydrogenase [Pseudomonadales bacterium]
MLKRRIKHSLYIGLMKLVAGLGPGSSHRAFVGRGSSRELCNHILRTGARKVLIVTDKPLRELGVVDQAIAALLASDVEVSFYDGVLPDPTFDQVAQGVRVARATGAEVILAIGGGSSIDAAKIIAASATSTESPKDWVGFGKVKHEILKLYVMPTTSGTGSEATIGAVISDSGTHLKSIISGATLLPRATALDPDLMVGLPPHITAATGMDALTHAIEAYIGVWERGTRLEDARIGVKLVFDNLAAAYRDGSNLEARAGMAMGAYYAGLAINQVNVGNVHAIAHQLGGKYGIPHGLANALVLPHVLEFCHDEAKPRLAELAVLTGLGASGENESQLAHKFTQAVKDLRTEVGIPDHSGKLQPQDFDAIAELAMAEGDGYPVPRLLDKASILSILGRIAG